MSVPLGSVGLSVREREMLTMAVRLAEAMRLGLDPEGFNPADGLPVAAREVARRAETQLRRRDLEQMQGQPLVVAAVSGLLVLSRCEAFPPRVTEELRGAVRKVSGRLRAQRIQA
ncbi:hypothetical protein [Deinococcus soli (ex Cha et al. 2016)]|uniref:hypothetical protein n=1 Tax=Deinococcus soli (ex Cha et al. 2016) TaxID=1309411 RepID=UPI001662C32D|nr:hypothetical protein [Deinococcus soli (ex Cha et al. 2016)]